MEYREDENYYHFEDDSVVIYDSTEPTKHSHCFVRIKPVIFSENEEAIFYLDSKMDGHFEADNTAVSFKIVFKATQTTYVGSLITPKRYIELLANVQRSEELYLFNNFHEKIVEEITPQTIRKVFEDIARGEGGWRDQDFLKV